MFGRQLSACWCMVAITRAWRAVKERLSGSAAADRLQLRAASSVGAQRELGEPAASIAPVRVVGHGCGLQRRQQRQRGGSGRVFQRNGLRNLQLMSSILLLARLLRLCLLLRLLRLLLVL